MNISSFIIRNFREKNEKVISIKKLKTSGNNSFIIETDKSKYILRLCGKNQRYRTYRELHSEIELLLFLKKHDVPVPLPINLGASKIIVTSHGNGFCYRYLKGNQCKDFDSAKYFLAGKMLGKIHSATKNFNFSFQRKSWGAEYLSKKLQELKKDFSIDLHLKKENFISKISYLIKTFDFPSELPRGAIHEDFGKRHVLFNGNVISGVLDWDRSYDGFYIMDVGQAIRGWCFDNWDRLNREKLKYFIKGYQSQRKLDNLEKKCLKKAVQFAFAERAVSFAINFLNFRRNEDLKFSIINLNLAYSLF